MHRWSAKSDPDNLAPTASATVALVLGHALTVALMRARNFSVDDFGRYHPGGHLGRSLRLTVSGRHARPRRSCLGAGRRIR